MDEKRTTIRLATFNVENLFSRLDFADAEQRDETVIGTYSFPDPVEARTARRIVEAAGSDDKRQLTAQALYATQADIVCLQEVDNRDALEVFYHRYLKRLIEVDVAKGKREVRQAALAAGMPPEAEAIFRVDRQHYFDWRTVIDGNDGRGIDVGVMSKIPMLIRTHAHRTFGELGVWSDELRNYRDRSVMERRMSQNDRVFRRDCLEIDIKFEGKALTIYVCHFKSMGPNRDLTRPMRRAEALAVRRIIEERFGRHAGEANWAICGDLNDYTEIDGLPILDDYAKPVPSGLDPLFQDGFAVNSVLKRAPEDRWTTYHGPEDQYAQLDNILLSPALARANAASVPEIIRMGLPYRANRYEGPRFARIGWDRPKASDHCPVVIELTLP